MTETERKTLVVDESGVGDYRTLTEAVAACAATPDEPVRFYIRHGIYEERPFIELADYVIEGEYRNATVITASVGGRDPWPGIHGFGSTVIPQTGSMTLPSAAGPADTAFSGGRSCRGTASEEEKGRIARNRRLLGLPNGASWTRPSVCELTRADPGGGHS